MRQPKQVKRPKRVTIKEVASEAGVSVAAVSKVMRDAYGVSDALRANVRATMDRLGYRPLASARGMRGKTYTLGVLFSDIRNPFFSDIMAGVDSALERTQYQPLLGISQAAIAVEEELINSMIDRQMDGIILVAPRLNVTRLEEIAANLPIVLIGRHTPAVQSFDTVNNDDDLGAQLVVKHLAEGGRPNIAMLSLKQSNVPRRDIGSATRQREVGYETAMRELGLDEFSQIVYAPTTLREIQTCVQQLLEGPTRPDAIFCWTDFVALEVIGVAQQLGFSIPEDVAIVGYDNTFLCDFTQNSLTSVDQFGEMLGQQSAQLLIERINGRTAAEHYVAKPRVVSRRSSQAR